MDRFLPHALVVAERKEKSGVGGREGRERRYSRHGGGRAHGMEGGVREGFVSAAAWRNEVK